MPACRCAVLWPPPLGPHQCGEGGVVLCEGALIAAVQITESGHQINELPFGYANVIYSAGGGGPAGQGL